MIAGGRDRMWTGMGERDAWLVKIMLDNLYTTIYTNLHKINTRKRSLIKIYDTRCKNSLILNKMSMKFIQLVYIFK